jgi:hypothetical protein
MAAAPPVYHDIAYNAIEAPADFDNQFSDALTTVCKVTGNTRWYLYSSGILSMKAVVELFPAHESADDFVDSVQRKEGKNFSVPLFSDPNFGESEFTLRFPLVQQSRLKAMRLYAIGQSYCGLPFNLPLMNEPTILRFSAFCTTIRSGKTKKDIPEAGIPLLPPAGDAASNYAAWSEKMVDFMSNYRSCYTGVPLSYLMRDDEAHKVADVATYETIEQFLIASVQFNIAINPAFVDENKVLAVVLNKAIGTSCAYATDLTLLLGRGQGRAAWTKLKVRVNGTAKALFARVQMLEMRLKDSFDGSIMKGFQAIQLHNIAFLKTVQDLTVAGSPISDNRQIRDYLMTIQDPVLLPLKDAIRADGGALTTKRYSRSLWILLKDEKLMRWQYRRTATVTSTQPSRRAPVTAKTIETRKRTAIRTRGRIIKREVERNKGYAMTGRSAR